MRTVRWGIVLCCLVALAAYAADPGPASVAPPGAGARIDVPARQGPTPWTNLKFNNNPDNFQFVIMSDRTGGHRDSVFARAVEKVNLLQPEFVMCIGDLIEGYTVDRNELKTQFDEFDAIVKPFEMPFFYMVGNHDISNGVMADVWRQRYGATYYHFVYRNVLFLVVCTEDSPKNPISDEQVAYVRRALQANKDVRWTILFMHQPLFLPGRKGKANPGWVKIEEMLKRRPHTVFAGHLHHYAKRRKYGRSYIHLATTGGASKLRGLGAGEFDHIVWVTMTDKGPRIANLMLDGIHDENIAAVARKRPARKAKPAPAGP